MMNCYRITEDKGYLPLFVDRSMLFTGSLYYINA